MKYIKLIAQKEVEAYFNSPAAYIVLVGFLLITGWFFASPLFLAGQADVRGMFTIVPLIYIVFIPAVTMGLISKEKAVGTMELLTTLPIKDSEIVIGKYFGSMFLLLVGLLFTLVHPLTIILLGKNIDYGQIIGGYIGLAFLGGVYNAIGVFASAITKNQIISFLVGFLIIFFFFVIQLILPLVPASVAAVMQYVSVGYHFDNMAKGVFDTRNIIYFLSLIFIFLKLSVTVLESRKW